MIVYLHTSRWVMSGKDAMGIADVDHLKKLAKMIGG